MTKSQHLKPNWHLIDAQNQIVGRLSTKIARLLMGKNKPYFVPYMDYGDNVVVINAKNVIFSGKKENQKTYWRHSGYPGGLKSKTAVQVRSSKPEDLIRHAVVGMLPKSKLGKIMLKKLFIYPEADHPHQDKINE